MTPAPQPTAALTGANNTRTSVRLLDVTDSCDLLCLDLDRAEKLRQSRLSEDAALATASLAKALADPTRLMLAVALRDADGELCVCDLAWVAERSEKLVSHHVRQLRLAGLVRSRRDGKMVMYRLTQTGTDLLDSLAALQASA